MSDLAHQLTTLPAPATSTQPASQFTRERQVRFLEALSVSGNVRAACRSACISPQTAYRFRRASADLARAWDAALLAARAHVEAVLADRALNGVEEPVFYHGEEIARRRRYDSRLLLAHLARLDKLAENAELADTAGTFDEALDAFRQHGTTSPPESEYAPEPSPEPAALPPQDAEEEQEEEHYPSRWDAFGLRHDLPDDEPEASPDYSAPAPRSARDLDFSDLYRLSDEDFAYLFSRLQQQKNARAADDDETGASARTPPGAAQGPRLVYP